MEKKNFDWLIPLCIMCYALCLMRYAKVCAAANKFAQQNGGIKSRLITLFRIALIDYFYDAFSIPQSFSPCDFILRMRSHDAELAERS